MLYEYCRTQIAKNAEIKMQEKQMYKVEGQLVREKQLAEKQNLERIKLEKLKQLQDIGIPVKYRGDLTKKKIT